MKSDRFSIGSEMGTRHSLHWTFNEEIFCSKSEFFIQEHDMENY